MLDSTIASRIRQGLFAGVCVFLLHAQGAAAYDIFWHNNYDPALSEAKRTGKPIFIAFRCVP